MQETQLQWVNRDWTWGEGGRHPGFRPSALGELGCPQSRELQGRSWWKEESVAEAMQR